MSAIWVAWRLILELMRDKRTFGFFIFAPVMVMSLVYIAVAEEEVANVGILTRGVARLYDYDLEEALSKEDDIQIVPLNISDEEIDPQVLEAAIREELLSGRVDGILYMNAELLPLRFDGKAGDLHIYVLGSNPTITGAVFAGMAAAMDDLSSALPVVIDSDCSSFCAESVNNKPINLEKHFIYGSDDMRQIDFFLPVILPFFIFFFTFIIAAITFQRERVRGTLERLLIAPVRLLDVVLGYVLGFLGFTGVQAGIIIAFFLALISFPISGAQLFGIAVISLLTLLSSLMVAFLVSFAAQNEFQVMQFIPIVIIPQFFLGDIIWRLESFPAFFQWLAWIMPLSWANRAIRNVVIMNQSIWQSWPELLALVIFSFVALLLLLGLGARKQV